MIRTTGAETAASNPVNLVNPVLMESFELESAVYAFNTAFGYALKTPLPRKAVRNMYLIAQARHRMDIAVRLENCLLLEVRQD